jgi:hypothetical protein
MEYSIEQIKDLYCKFTCKYANGMVEIDDISIDPCEYCQVNNFIRELRDQKIII